MAQPVTEAPGPAAAAHAGLAYARPTAAAILVAFRDYNAEFARLTRLAARHFAEREWRLAQRDAVARIALYEARVARCVADLVGRMGRWIADEATWRATRDAYDALLVDEEDSQFCRTFFNSLTRRVFATEGVNPTVEFTADPPGAAGMPAVPPCRHAPVDDVQAVAAAILGHIPGQRPLADRARGIAQVAAVLAAGVRGAPPQAVEMIDAVFYRATRAFLVGRLVGAQRMAPLVIALRSTADGPVVDAVLATEREVRTLFGFSRAPFHVDLAHVAPVVRFLAAMMPRKSPAELYAVLGRAKQGKTERYRSLMQHLSTTDDCFDHAEGQRGMVMSVFTMPSYDSVFKVIRDRFAYPKSTTRAEVMARYQFVFRHDRAGRLVDAQEFRRLRIPRARFAPRLLGALLDECAESCRLDGDDLVIGHCYIERRLRPLDVFLRTASPAAARAAVIDYGQAIRELALSNVFPGDLLPKNFGVSNNGRVVFYDYDELCLVTDCRFRDLPPPTCADDEMRAEPWFHVGPDDVFPAQFIGFLGLPAALREVFVARHGDLLDAAWWRDLAEAHAAERFFEVLPYAMPRPAVQPEAIDAVA